jgi:histone acetyltransferase (RNA polymerase elongator complex component)
LVDKSIGKPLIVPFFIPFQGCPHRCVYCEQEKITNQPIRRLERKAIVDVIERAFHSQTYKMKNEREIAFYGGTFTGLPYETMRELLGAVTPYMREGFVTSIRVSTRPDAVDEEKLKFLKEYGVSTIELGAQSMCDEVLALTRRGHTRQDTIRAVQLLKKYHIRAGIQLMPGLPGDSEETFLDSVQKVIELDVDMVRLYPTVVIRGTELARWYEEGTYRPLGLEDAVRICKKSCILLEGRRIPVIRIGLMSSPAFQEEGQIIAGPWHEAFGHLVRSSIYFDKIKPQLACEGEAARIRLRVPPKEISLLRGFRNEGFCRLQASTGARIEEMIADPSLPSGQVKVERI